MLAVPLEDVHVRFFSSFFFFKLLVDSTAIENGGSRLWTGSAIPSARAFERERRQAEGQPAVAAPEQSPPRDRP